MSCRAAASADKPEQDGGVIAGRLDGATAVDLTRCPIERSYINRQSMCVGQVPERFYVTGAADEKHRPAIKIEQFL
jgi:hypothetical protein